MKRLVFTSKSQDNGIFFSALLQYVKLNFILLGGKSKLFGNRKLIKAERALKEMDKELKENVDKLNCEPTEEVMPHYFRIKNLEKLEAEEFAAKQVRAETAARELVCEEWVRIKILINNLF